jgi:hypothetical protein
MFKVEPLDPKKIATPVTDYVREALKDPKFATEFADTWNHLAQEQAKSP